MSNLVPRELCSDYQNLEVNLLSLSYIMDMGTPCSRTISLMYFLVSFFILQVSLIGRKCADFVNRSTITQMVFRPPVVLGNLVIKSIVIRSQFHSGISGCCSKPEGFWYSTLTLAQVRHLSTKVAIYVFMLGNQYNFLRSRYILSEPG